MKKRKYNYDYFHKNTKLQKKFLKKNNFTYRNVFKALDRYINESMSVLDIGCGSGSISFYVAKKVKKVVGIDVSMKAVDNCINSAKQLRISEKAAFKRVNFLNLNELEKFDMIIMNEVIEHIQEDKKAIKKVSLLLNEGGYLYISTPSRNAPLYKIGLLKKFDKNVGHVRRYLEDDLINMVSSFNLILVEQKETEGILRNFLFTNKTAGISIKFIRYILSDIITLIDNMLIQMFGNSNITLIFKKT